MFPDRIYCRSTKFVSAGDHSNPDRAPLCVTGVPDDKYLSPSSENLDDCIVQIPDEDDPDVLTIIQTVSIWVQQRNG